MNLTKLFEMQAKLDKHIYTEHPVQEGEDRLSKKILALQVELGECANEWRGFKYWSNDQEPRREKIVNIGYKTIYKNPLLEEYVDCLHFILSIGLESGVEWLIDYDYTAGGYLDSKYTILQFKLVFNNVSNFDNTYDPEDYISLVSEFIGLGVMLGFTWDQIEQAYFEKNKINHQRQEEGY